MPDLKIWTVAPAPGALAYTSSTQVLYGSVAVSPGPIIAVVLVAE